MNDLTRREALTVAGAIAGVCACCAFTPSTALADDDDKPRRGGGGGDKTPPPKTLQIGKLTDYPKAGYYDQYAKQKIMVRRLDDRLVAMTVSCTHKGCPVKINADDHDTLKCPCHKGVFSPQGTPTAGPPRTALDRFAVKQGADGTITVDTTHRFIESKWEEPDAFIPIKGEGK